jgi:hypothetical protein
MTLTELKAEFRDRALEPDTLFLLNGPDAIAFIERAAAHGFRLMGVEGFRITDLGAYQPEQDQGNDIADVNLSDAEFVESTKKLIRDGTRLGFRYQVVVANGV